MSVAQDAIRPLRADTGGLPATQQFDAWHTLMWRIDLARPADAPAGFDARLEIERASSGIELWDHVSDAVDVRRDAQRCRRDGGDEIYVSLALEGPTWTEQAGRSIALPAGSLYVADFAQPLSARWSRHRELALVIPRERAQRTLASQGGNARLRRLLQTGAAALLAMQLRMLRQEAGRLPPPLLDATLEHCADLALCALGEHDASPSLPDRSPDVLRRQAMAMITRHCADPELTPKRLADLLHVSRSTLFEAFRHSEPGLETSIWQARLELAHMRLLTNGPTCPIAETAIACGFLDMAGFSRMYRRRYDLRPLERRAQGREV